MQCQKTQKVLLSAYGKIFRNKWLLVEAEDYVEKAIQDTEELPFD